jgi:hypothetical protein
LKCSSSGLPALLRRPVARERPDWFGFRPEVISG